MTVLRCTVKLLKRLKLPAKPPEPEAQANPLGEWYADIDFWNRKPFVVMLNGATGATLILNGNAAGLRILHERAAVQFGSLCEFFELHGASVRAELQGFATGFTYAPTRDRSLLASLRHRNYGAWLGFEQQGLSSMDSAAREWDGLFQHPALGRDPRLNSEYHVPLDLLRRRLMRSATILPFNTTRH